MLHAKTIGAGNLHMIVKKYPSWGENRNFKPKSSLKLLVYPLAVQIRMVDLRSLNSGYFSKIVTS